MRRTAPAQRVQGLLAAVVEAVPRQRRHNAAGLAVVVEAGSVSRSRETKAYARAPAHAAGLAVVVEAVLWRAVLWALERNEELHVRRELPKGAGTMAGGARCRKQSLGAAVGSDDVAVDKRHNEAGGEHDEVEQLPK
jgi:hypothetical protein